MRLTLDCTELAQPPGQWVEGGPWRGSLAWLSWGVPWQALPQAVAGSQVHLGGRAHTDRGWAHRGHLGEKTPSSGTPAARELRPLPVTGELRIQTAVGPQSSVSQLPQEGPSFCKPCPANLRLPHPAGLHPPRPYAWVPGYKAPTTWWAPGFLADLPHNLAAWLLTQLPFCRGRNRSAERGRNFQVHGQGRGGTQKVLDSL